MRSTRDRRIAFVMILPSLFLLAIFVYGFIFATFQNSLTDWGEDRRAGSAMAAARQSGFVGIDNYRNLMTDALEFDFRTSMVNTFFYTIFFVGGCLFVGFVLAALLDMRIRFEGLFRTIFLFPMALSLVVTGTIWRWLYQPVGLNSLPERLFGLEPYSFNWINSRKRVLPFDWNDVPLYLTYIGLFILSILVFNYLIKRRWGAMGWALVIAGVLGFLQGVDFWTTTVWPQTLELDLRAFTPDAPPPGPEADMKGFQVALTGIIIAAVWQMAGYTMAMFLAGMRGVPDELREAARVDGCTELGVYWRVVLPQLRPVALSAMIILGHISLKSFDLIFAMSGKDNFQTLVPGIIVYSAFDNDRFARASAVAVVMLVLVCTVIIPYLWTQLRERRD
ncbi:MAG: sugar ABC transporter permease [Anaerolineaceae bacterium]|nr:MAG: sugar ABC transporter permease [Anaerolineaceae bacterium]